MAEQCPACGLRCVGQNEDCASDIYECGSDSTGFRSDICGQLSQAKALKMELVATIGRLHNMLHLAVELAEDRQPPTFAQKQRFNEAFQMSQQVQEKATVEQR